MGNRVLLLTTLSILAAESATAQQHRDFGPYLMADRAAEVTLARSAAARHVSDSATVLVLTSSGFVEASRGSNGFTCLVLRSFLGGVSDPGFWNPKVRAPNCFNPPAVASVLPEILRRTEWLLAGVDPLEVERRSRKAYASHEFSMPGPGAMAYMLSPAQHLVDTDPQWVPHLMLFYPGSMSAAALGAGEESPTIINGSAGDPTSPVLTLLIPVRRWSDGTLAMTGVAH